MVQILKNQDVGVYAMEAISHGHCLYHFRYSLNAGDFEI